MKMVRKTMALNQDAINRIKAELNVKTEKEAVNVALRQFGTEIQLAEATRKLAGKMNIEDVYQDQD